MASTGLNTASPTDSKRRSPAPRTTGGRVEVQLVELAGGEDLLDGARPARYGDLPVAGDLACPRERLVEPAGDEDERGAAFHGQRLALMVGEDEDRRAVGRAFAPPPTPGLIPGAFAASEHAPPHDVGAVAAQDPLRHRRVDRVWTALGEGPPVEELTPLAERVLATLVRSGGEAVERDGDVAGGGAHRATLRSRPGPGPPVPASARRSARARAASRSGADRGRAPPRRAARPASA
jgi:hypothetical protein